MQVQDTPLLTNRFSIIFLIIGSFLPLYSSSAKTKRDSFILDIFPDGGTSISLIRFVGLITILFAIITLLVSRNGKSNRHSILSVFLVMNLSLNAPLFLFPFNDSYPVTGIDNYNIGWGIIIMSTGYLLLLMSVFFILSANGRKGGSLVDYWLSLQEEKEI